MGYIYSCICKVKEIPAFVFYNVLIWSVTFKFSVEQGLYGVSHILVSPQHYLNQPQFYEDEEDDGQFNLIRYL